MSLTTAKRRLQRLADPAVRVFEGILNSIAPCPLCGSGNYRDPIALRAAELVLDRIGMGPTLKIEATYDHHDLLDEMTDEELAIVDGVMERVKARLDTKEALGLATLPETISAPPVEVTSLPPVQEDVPPVAPVVEDAEEFES